MASYPSELSAILSGAIELSRSPWTRPSIVSIAASCLYGAAGGAKAAEALEKKGTSLEKVKEIARMIPEYARKMLVWNLKVLGASYLLRVADPSIELPSPLIGMAGITCAIFMGALAGACRNWNLRKP